ncbi:MAG: PEGA domain-containing protein [Acidobacteriota bacterium]
MRARLLAAAFLLLVLDLPGQVVVEEIGTLQDAFVKAEQSFQAFRFGDAVGELVPVEATLSRWEGAGRLTPSDEALLQKTLELRGVCLFNLGRLDEARADFSRLIQLRADYPFSRSRAPKAVRFYEETRNLLTGTVDLDVDPSDSQVFLDGRALGSGAARSIPVLKGLHVFRFLRSGYDAAEREVNVDVGSRLAVSVRLVPNARTIFIFAQPQGVQLSLNGKVVGRAERPASTQPEWAHYAKTIRTDPSSVYVIPALNLPPGEHTVVLSKPCYAPKTFLLNVVLDRERNLPGYVKTVVLEKKTVDLEVTSRPAGAQVLVDGLEMGTTPLKTRGFCIGEHEFLVQKPGVGEFRARLQVPESAVFRLDATLRPTLVWAGLTRTHEIPPEEMVVLSGLLDEKVASLALFNVTPASEEKDPLLPDTFFVHGVSPEVRASTTALLCERYRCQGLVVGRLDRDPESGEKILSLRLFAPGLNGFDEFTGRGPAAEQTLEALRLLDEPVLAFTPDRILPVGEAAGRGGPVILRDLASRGGPAPGDGLLGVDGAVTSGAQEARDLLARALEPEIRILHEGLERTWRVVPSSFTRVVPDGPDARKRCLLSRQALLSAEDPAQSRAARLNLAFAHLNMGRPSEALESLEGSPESPEGSPGTSAVAYARAVALLHLDRTEEARPFLLAAASDRDGSLDGLGDILVQPLAEDLLRQIPPAAAPTAPAPRN